MFLSSKQRSDIFIEFVMRLNACFIHFDVIYVLRVFFRLSWPVTELKVLHVISDVLVSVLSWSTFLVRVNLTFLHPAYYPVDAVHDGHDSPDLSSPNDVCNQSRNQSYQGKSGRK